MPDPTPEERAEALRLVEEEFAYQAASGSTRAAMALEAARDALRAVESERAELAREVERADQLREGYYVDAQQQRERAERAEREVEELRGALRRILALSEPTEGEESARD